MRFFLFICIIFSLAACNKTPSNLFTLAGVVENAGDSKNVILYYFSIKEGEWHEIADTTKIINGKFLFRGDIDELTAAELCFDDSNVVISARMYLEPTTMKLRINKNQPYAYQLSGIKVEKENIELRRELEPYEKVNYQNEKFADSIVGQIRLHENNTLVQDSLLNYLRQYLVEQKIGDKMNKTTLDFILKHPTYQIVPDLLYLLTKSESIPIDTIKSIYNSLPEQSKTSLMGKLAYKQIEYVANKKDTSVGNIASDFTRKDFLGRTVKLSEFRDRNYVLLDFWASWCMPCIEGIPKLKDLFSKYSGKGLTIISISLDNDNNSWLNAIHKYQLEIWPQILAVKDKNFDDLSFIYNVQAIPHFILIDKHGKIIANGQGEKQLNKIDSILRLNFSIDLPVIREMKK